MGELELAKLREVEMGFGGERRDEEDSKEQKQDLQMPGIKSEHGTVQYIWRRGRGRTDRTFKCILDQKQ